jgi:hypothetical protein
MYSEWVRHWQKSCEDRCSKDRDWPLAIQQITDIPYLSTALNIIMHRRVPPCLVRAHPVQAGIKTLVYKTSLNSKYMKVSKESIRRFGFLVQIETLYRTNESFLPVFLIKEPSGSLLYMYTEIISTILFLIHWNNKIQDSIPKLGDYTSFLFSYSTTM